MPCAGVHAACCDGGCVDLWTDIANCGFCGFGCPSATRLEPGCCDGLYVDLWGDDFNCGFCGNRCDTGVPCLMGRCEDITDPH